MHMVLSPAKSLAMDSPLPELALTQPYFLAQAQSLIKVLAKKQIDELQVLMNLSHKLAALNVARYRSWTPLHQLPHSRAAILTFDGDVYQGLDARTLSKQALLWANSHLSTLSGLYGVLRPLDWMQAYRLEMGTALTVGKAPHLYAFWGNKIAKRLDEALALTNSSTIVNLASQEYFKSVDLKALKAPVIECVFEEGKDGQYKVIGLFAKRARGRMARFAIDHTIDKANDLKAFDADGYRYSADASTPARWVFRRNQPPPIHQKNDF